MTRDWRITGRRFLPQLPRRQTAAAEPLGSYSYLESPMTNAVDPMARLEELRPGFAPRSWTSARNSPQHLQSTMAQRRS